MTSPARQPDTASRLASLARGRTLDEPAAAGVFADLLEGRLDDAQIGALLALLAARGPTPEELIGAARVMRAHVTPVAYEPASDERLIDTCGTGGAPKTFNVSTVAAIIAAGIEPPGESGVRRIVVAKHGNRSRTGRGSAEVLAALGVNLDATPEAQSRCLRDAGVCFSFAIRHHPAMVHAAGPRRSLGFPTIFNLLGPLTNPAGAKRQLLGVAQREHVALVARALCALGADRAGVAHSDDGLDELGVTAPNTLAWIDAGRVRTERVDPGDPALGLDENGSLAGATLAALAADSVEQAARIARAVVDGSDRGPRRSMALLNAGAAAVVAGVVDDLSSGVSLARVAVDSGRAQGVLASLARASHAG
ncbi:MAG: anthranilate phosphoribosyltransferase [Planctomycetota bacterium]